ncbi:hypothetical protein [Ornithinimicrobium sufpigmenti]|uniref:hypothetical protein n=1 Tax=Ornithinimicrobium sufpigmenti TaxID=2508882 RepID=UPI0010362B2F|nr:MULTISPECIES: hypothetical protein [unclassified Ornithinimicrobium]
MGRSSRAAARRKRWRWLRRAAGTGAAAGGAMGLAALSVWLDLGRAKPRTMDPIEERLREEQARLARQAPFIR